jgi:hypothetical protein
MKSEKGKGRSEGGREGGGGRGRGGGSKWFKAKKWPSLFCKDTKESKNTPRKKDEEEEKGGRRG